MSNKREIAKKNRQRGKRNEKVLSKLLGMDRVGIFGGEDAKDERFSAEFKSRKKFVGMKWMEQTVKNCPEGKIPIVVVHVMNQRRQNDIVMIRLKDWVDIINSSQIPKQ